MPTRVLVTGGAGFVGSNLVDRLIAEGHQVDVVDDLSAGSLANLAEARRNQNRLMTFHQMDIASPALDELLQRTCPQIVYHLAAATHPAMPPAEVAERVFAGSLRVIEAARSSGAQKVVYASSAAIYGEVERPDLPVRESYPQLPLSARGVADKAVFDFLRAYRELHSLEFTVLVFDQVYGPRQSDRGLPGAVAASVLSSVPSWPAPLGPAPLGEPHQLPGGGAQTRDFVYVDDAVDALARAAERGGGLALNIGVGVEVPVSELHRALAVHAGAGAGGAEAGGASAGGAGAGGAEAGGAPGVTASASAALAGEVARLSLDPGRAAIHLGWKPWTTLHEGAGATISWYRSA